MSNLAFKLIPISTSKSGFVSTGHLFTTVDGLDSVEFNKQLQIQLKNFFNKKPNFFTNETHLNKRYFLENLYLINKYKQTRCSISLIRTENSIILSANDGYDYYVHIPLATIELIQN